MVNDISAKANTNSKSSAKRSNSSSSHGGGVGSSGGGGGGGIQSSTSSSSSLNRSSSKTTNHTSSSSASSKKPSSNRMSTNSVSSSSCLSNYEENNGEFDKERHKLYAGISSKFIKCAWEQHSRSDIDVAPEVYSKLSEDVTYKLWELVNNIKTYSRHCGGYVSADLVNDVLKDANVPPVLGSTNLPWDKIETDRFYYFPADEVVDLSKVYMEDMKDENCGEPKLTAIWTSTHPNSNDLKEYATKLCTAVFIGADDAFDYALELTQTDPNIGCVLKILLQEICRKLTEDYTSQSLEKCLRFINAIAYNPYTRDACVDIDLITMAELLICVILGPHKRHRKYEMEQERVKLEEQIVKKVKVEVISDENDVKMEDLGNVSSPESVNCDPIGAFDKTDDANEFVRIYKNFYRRTRELQQEHLEDRKDSVKSGPPDENTVGAGGSSIGIGSVQPVDYDMLPADMMMTANQLSVGEPTLDPTNDLNEIDDPDFANFVKYECEELFAKFEEIRNSNQNPQTSFDGFNIKKEMKTENFESEQSINLDNSENALNVSDGVPATILMNVDDIKAENHSQYITFDGSMIADNIGGNSGGIEGSMLIDSGQNVVVNKDVPPISREIINYIKIYTKMCKRKSMISAISTLGLACAQWGYFEKIVSILLRIRMQKFFEENHLFTRIHYDWIVRAIYAQWAVGEETMRNFFTHLPRIDPDKLPELYECHFNVIATFVGGFEDTMTYYHLYAISGDKIFPNMIYFYQSLKRLSVKYVKKSKPPTEKIIPKLLLKKIPRRTTSTTKNELPVVFEDMVTDTSKLVNLNCIRRTKINFKFPGCRPPLNLRLKKVIKIAKVEPKPSESQIINSGIIVARRKIMTPISNEIKPRKFVNITDYNL